MSNKVIIILIAVFLLVLALMGTGFFIMFNKLSAQNQTDKEAGEMTEDGKPIKKMGPIHSLDTFIVNLADPGGGRYLRVTMNLELKDEETVKLLVSRMPQIRNAVLMVLPTKKYEDIATVKGKTEMRDEVIEKMNDILNKGSVLNIYFTEFVVQ